MALAFFYKHKGFVQLDEDNNPEKAEESFRKAHKFNKEYYRTFSDGTAANKEFAYDWLDIGISLVRQGKYDKGLKKLNKSEIIFKKLYPN